MVEKNRVKKILYGVLIFFALLLVTVTIIEFTFPHEKVIRATLKVHEASPCKYNNGEWIKTNTFSEKDDVAICTNITSDIPDDNYYLITYIYKDSVKDTGKALYDRGQRISLSDGVIHINYQFEPGMYFVVGYYIRDFLFELPIEVMSENN